MGYAAYDQLELAEKKIADLEKEVQAYQTTLGLILYHLGEPFVLTDKMVVEGLPEGATIYIDEDSQSMTHTMGITIITVDE